MCPSVVVDAGSGGVSVEVLGVGMFECHKLADFLSFGEWP